jgi:hypothetical protein
LEDVLELEPLPIYHPADLNWRQLPDRAVIQLHWNRSDYLQGLLEAANIKMVTLSRHPFDVILSILRFAQTEPDTSLWLWGEGGDEESIVGADPSSESFVRWALSERALALLGVTGSWLEVEGTAHIPYEALVGSPESEVLGLLKRWSLTPLRPIADAVEKVTPEFVNRIGGISHAWMGSSGLWKELLPSELIDPLKDRYRNQLNQLGYDTHSHSVLDGVTVRTRWQELLPTIDNEGYQAELRIFDPVSSVCADSTMCCLVKVHNRGTFRWPDRGRHPVIRIGCRWFADDGSELFLPQNRQLLIGPMPPGAGIYQPTVFPTPAKPGKYRLQIDLVHEEVRWFGCGPTFEVNVDLNEG